MLPALEQLFPFDHLAERQPMIDDRFDVAGSDQFDEPLEVLPRALHVEVQRNLLAIEMTHIEIKLGPGGRARTGQSTAAIEAGNCLFRRLLSRIVEGETDSIAGDASNLVRPVLIAIAENFVGAQRAQAFG